MLINSMFFLCYWKFRVRAIMIIRNNFKSSFMNIGQYVQKLPDQ